jgi:hypothetical protein
MEYFENVHFTNPQIVSALVHLLCKTTIWNIYYIQSLYGEYTVTIKSTVRMCAPHERHRSVGLFCLYSRSLLPL